MLGRQLAPKMQKGSSGRHWASVPNKASQPSLAPTIITNDYSQNQPQMALQPRQSFGCRPSHIATRQLSEYAGNIGGFYLVIFGPYALTHSLLPAVQQPLRPITQLFHRLMSRGIQFKQVARSPQSATRDHATRHCRETPREWAVSHFPAELRIVSGILKSTGTQGW